MEGGKTQYIRGQFSRGQTHSMVDLALISLQFNANGIFQESFNLRDTDQILVGIAQWKVESHMIVCWPSHHAADTVR